MTHMLMTVCVGTCMYTQVCVHHAWYLGRGALHPNGAWAMLENIRTHFPMRPALQFSNAVSTMQMSLFSSICIL